jgi:hypothetical protein
MICAIHQPNFLPYLGFFSKYKNSDSFVLYDTAQYSKNDYHNRNTIKTSNGPIWLTVPVSMSLGQLIKDVQLANTDFVGQHLKTLEFNYKKTPFFEKYFPAIKEIYSKPKLHLLVDLTIPLLEYFFELLDANKKVILASSLDLDVLKKSTDALVEITKKVGANEYLAGKGSKDYLEEAKFDSSGLKLTWQDFHHPKYLQLWGEFVPNMSVIDALFNIGHEEILKLL